MSCQQPLEYGVKRVYSLGYGMEIRWFSTLDKAKQELNTDRPSKTIATLVYRQAPGPIYDLPASP